MELEFFDITPLKAGAASRPSIKAGKRGLVITIPGHVAARAGLDQAGPVKLKAAMNGSLRGVLVCPAEDGAWALSKKDSVVSVTARELLPANGYERDVELDCELREGGLLINLPAQFKLKDEHVVKRPPAPRTAPTGR